MLKEALFSVFTISKEDPDFVSKFKDSFGEIRKLKALYYIKFDASENQP